MFNIVIKTVLIYLLIIFSMRIMGKKLAAELQPYELVVMLMIAEVASTPMDSPGIPILYGLAPAATLLGLYSLLSFITRKSRRLRLLLCGAPSILIHNGKLEAAELKKIGYSLDDLMEQLRQNGCTSITDVHYAILETNGQLSVLPYSRCAPLTPEALGVEVEEEEMFFVLIQDGCIQSHGLDKLGIRPGQIAKLAHTLGFPKIREVLLFTMNSSGSVFIQDKGGRCRDTRVTPLVPGGMPCTK